MSELAPSILAADFNRLGENIKEVEQAGVKVLHIDVMDGLFVPSISFGMPLITSIRKESGMFFDVHLMVQDPERYIDEFVGCGADSITIHIEACKKVRETIEQIHEKGIKAAISLNPETDLDEIKEFLPIVDMVLVMSVHPGFGGQKLIPETLDKIKELKRLREEKGYSYKIEIDGGVNRENIAQIAEIGTDYIVAGTAVFAGDIKENVVRLKEVMAGAS